MKPKILFVALPLLLIAGLAVWKKDLFLKPGGLFGEKKLPDLVSFEPSMKLMSYLESENFRAVHFNSLPSDMEKVTAILKWVGENLRGAGQPAGLSQDPQTLLEQAKNGQPLGSTELAIVTVALARALALPARVVHFSPADTDAVHSVAEIFLFDQKRWVMVDSRWARIPHVGPQPIGAAEFSRDRDSKELKFMNGDRYAAADPAYSAWMAPYLYFIAFPVDQRYGSANPGQDHILLMPKGASEPDQFLGRPMEGKLHGTTSTRVLYGFELK